MICASTAILSKNLSISQSTKSGAGIASNADSPPTYSVWEETGTTAIVTGTMTLIVTGQYAALLAITTANGYEENKSYYVTGVATVGAVAYPVGQCGFMVLGSAPLSTSTTSDNLYNRLISAASDAIEKYCDRIFTETSYVEEVDDYGDNKIMLKQYPIISITKVSRGRQDAISLQNTSSDAYNAYVTVNATQMLLTVEGGANAGTSTLTLASYATMTLLVAAINGLGTGWTAETVSGVALWAASELLPAWGENAFNNVIYPAIPSEPLAGYRIDSEAGMISQVRASGYYDGYYNDEVYTGFAFYPDPLVGDNKIDGKIIVKYTAGFATIPFDIEQATIELTKTYLNRANVDTSLESEKLGDYSYKVSQAVNAGIPDTIRGMIELYRRRA